MRSGCSEPGAVSRRGWIQVAEDAGDQGDRLAGEQLQVHFADPVERRALDDPDQPGLRELIHRPVRVGHPAWCRPFHSRNLAYVAVATAASTLARYDDG